MLNRQEINNAIVDFLNSSPLNSFPQFGIDRVFANPIIGCADAEDSLFKELKEDARKGGIFLAPQDWLADAKIVISYFLPFTEEMREANYSDGLPAESWVYGRIEGEMCNDAVRRHLIELITDCGGKAIAPPLEANFSIVQKQSNWSERHVAFVAGLGSFGLSRSIITEKGSAGRFGSVITDLSFEVTSRPYRELTEYCTECGVCISRCPSKAITPEGMEMWTCSDYLDLMRERFSPRYGCGKCQTRVPCECGMP